MGQPIEPQCFSCRACLHRLAGIVLAVALLTVAAAAPAVAAAPDDSVQASTRVVLDADHDADGIPDSIDIDDDNDTVSDDNEGWDDPDGDGVPNLRDNDSDNDGIPDLIEHIQDLSVLVQFDDSQAGEESFDGLLDSDIPVGVNGLADLTETMPDSGIGTTGFYDTDNDGVRDQLDRDSDNDGIGDVFEFGCETDMRTRDIDRDARLDSPVDANGDGLDDLTRFVDCGAYDEDADGQFDYRDTDSDGDGLSDALEAFDDDTDGDGQTDRFVDNDGDGLEDAYADSPRYPKDTDGDGFPDYLDVDSDNNDVSDAQEAGVADAAGAQPETPTDSAELPEAVQSSSLEAQGDQGIGGVSAAAAPEISNDEPPTAAVVGASRVAAGCSLSGGLVRGAKQPLDLLLLLALALAVMLTRRWQCRSLPLAVPTRN